MREVLIRELRANQIKLNRLFIRSRHKAGTTGGAQGRDDGWGIWSGRRMGHMVGTADGAYGRDDGWGASTGSCILGKVWTDVLSEFTNTTTVTPESAKRATVIPENAKRLSGTFIDCAIFSVFPLDRLIHIALLALQQHQDAVQ